MGNCLISFYNDGILYKLQFLFAWFHSFYLFSISMNYSSKINKKMLVRNWSLYLFVVIGKKDCSYGMKGASVIGMKWLDRIHCNNHIHYERKLTTSNDKKIKKTNNHVHKFSLRNKTPEGVSSTSSSSTFTKQIKKSTWTPFTSFLIH